MRLSLRFVVPLLLVLAAMAYAVLPLVDRLTVRWFMRDLDLRATLVARTVEDPLSELTRVGNAARIRQFFTKISQDERIYALAYCPTPEAQAFATPSLPVELQCDSLERFEGSGTEGHMLTSVKGPLLVSVRPLTSDSTAAGRLVLVHDMSFVERRSEETRRYLFYFFIGLGVTVSLITVIVAQLSWRGWEQGVRALLRGEGLCGPPMRTDVPEFRPDRERPSGADSRHRGRAPHAQGGAGGLDAAIRCGRYSTANFAARR